MRKHQHYGIKGAAYNFFASFLTNRFQFVSISNVKSNFMPFTCGVPQGSVLSPLLFTLYINDISNCTTSKPRLFAGDTCLMMNNRNLSQLNSNIDEEITTVNNWIIANKLTLNIAKSSGFLINSNNKNCNNSKALSTLERRQAKRRDATRCCPKRLCLHYVFTCAAERGFALK